MAAPKNDSTTEETLIEENEAKKTTTKGVPEKKEESYVVKVPLLNVRERASTASEIVGTLSEGDTVEITARTPQGFGRLADDSGYVKLEFVEKRAGK